MQQWFLFAFLLILFHSRKIVFCQNSGTRPIFYSKGRACSGEWQMMKGEIITKANLKDETMSDIEECRYLATYHAWCQVMHFNKGECLLYNSTNLNIKQSADDIYYIWTCRKSDDICKNLQPTKYASHCFGYWLTYVGVVVNMRPFAFSQSSQLASDDCLANFECGAYSIELNQVKLFAIVAPDENNLLISPKSSAPEFYSVYIWKCCNNGKQHNFDPHQPESCYGKEEFKPCPGQWYNVPTSYTPTQFPISYSVMTTSMCTCVSICAAHPLCYMMSLNVTNKICSLYSLDFTYNASQWFANGTTMDNQTSTSFRYYWRCNDETNKDDTTTTTTDARHLTIRSSYGCVRSTKQSEQNFSLVCDNCPQGTVPNTKVKFTANQYFYYLTTPSSSSSSSNDMEILQLDDGLGSKYYLLSSFTNQPVLMKDKWQDYLNVQNIYACDVACGRSDCPNQIITPNQPFIPQIISREQWKAQYPNYNDMNLYTKEPYQIGLHHTFYDWCLDYNETSKLFIENCYSFMECAAMVRNYQRCNIQVVNYADIGFHFMIGGDGSLFECRSLQYIGAHSLGENHISIGVALLGAYSNHSLPTHATRQTFDYLTKLLLQQQNISHFYYIRPFQANFDVHLLNYLSTWKHFQKEEKNGFCIVNGNIEKISYDSTFQWIVSIFVGLLTLQIVLFSLLRYFRHQRHPHVSLCRNVCQIISTQNCFYVHLRLLLLDGSRPQLPHIVACNTDFYLLRNTATPVNCHWLQRVKLLITHLRMTRKRKNVLEYLLESIYCNNSSCYCGNGNHVTEAIVMAAPNSIHKLCLLYHDSQELTVEQLGVLYEQLNNSAEAVVVDICLCKHFNVENVENVTMKTHSLPMSVMQLQSSEHNSSSGMPTLMVKYFLDNIRRECESNGFELWHKMN